MVAPLVTLIVAMPLWIWHFNGGGMFLSWTSLAIIVGSATFGTIVKYLLSLN